MVIRFATASIKLDSGFHATAGSSLSYTAKIRTDYLQALDYRYNIRGQLLSMNNASLTVDTLNNADVNDVFGMEMLYDKSDGGLGNTAYYNGRLSAVKWMTRSGTAYGTKSAQRAYNYSYDELNRLTDASYYEKATGGSWVATGAYDEKNITYDMNGNILALKRNGVLSGAVKRIDSLVYSYDGNQLTNITDGTGSQYTANGFKNLSGSSSTTPYSYDDNGNLATDLKKGIVNHYNILNRVDSIRVTAGTNQWISYTYDATGTLLRKKQYNISGTTPVKTTDYIDGFVYENSSLVYFAAAEGRVRDSANVLTNEYVITDTQGNSRISFEDNGSGIAKIRQENSYYPFGLVMGNSTTPANNANKHLYNGGSEWQNDYADLPDYYQTFFRNYDPAIGRFVSVDTRAESAESMTVYQYAYNNPGMLNDPLGDLISGEYADFWNQILNRTGNGVFNQEWHNEGQGYWSSTHGDDDFFASANWVNNSGSSSGNNNKDAGGANSEGSMGGRYDYTFVSVQGRPLQPVNVIWGDRNSYLRADQNIQNQIAEYNQAVKTVDMGKYGTLTIKLYTPYIKDLKLGAKVLLGVNNNTGYKNLRWVQIISTNDPLRDDLKSPYIDRRPDSSLPFYPDFPTLYGFDSEFHDQPARNIPDISKANIYWKASLMLVGVRDNTYYPLFQINYGFTIQNNDYHLIPMTFSTPLSTSKTFSPYFP